jgi:hypothetical protein
VGRRPDSAAAAATPAVARWVPRREAGTWRYELRTEATVGLTSDSAAQHVPVASTTLYTITVTPAGDRFRLAGQVDSTAVQAGSRVPPPQHPDSTRPAFRAELLPDGTLAALQSTTPAPCAGGTEPVVAAVQSLFVRLPTTLAVGATWQDTVATVTCRGDLPITSTAVRRYRLVGPTTWNGRPALEVERTGTMALASPTDTSKDTSTTSTSAAGTNTNRMSVTGTGTSTTTLQIDPATGLLLSSRGEHHATLTVTAGRSTLPFQQDAIETITLRP